MKTTVIDGKEYALVPVAQERARQRMLREFKTLYREAMLYPDLNCGFPLDVMTAAMKTLLGSKWSEYALTLKAEILESLADDDKVFPESMEPSERPYTFTEYRQEILPRFMGLEAMEDFWDGDY